MARGRASPGQRPWESWPEAVRVLTRGRRARGIFPGPNPSEPQVVHDVASKRQIISFLLANSHCCSRSRKADMRHCLLSILLGIELPAILAAQGTLVGLNPWARLVAIVLFISLSIAISPIPSAWGLSSRFIAFRRGNLRVCSFGTQTKTTRQGQASKRTNPRHVAQRRTPSCPCPR